MLLVWPCVLLGNTLDCGMVQGHVPAAALMLVNTRLNPSEKGESLSYSAATEQGCSSGETKPGWKQPGHTLASGRGCWKEAWAGKTQRIPAPPDSEWGCAKGV